MSDEIEQMLNKEKIEVEHLRLMKTKQSFEAVFIVMVCFSIMITLGDIVFSKSKTKPKIVKKSTMKLNESTKGASTSDALFAKTPTTSAEAIPEKVIEANKTTIAEKTTPVAEETKTSKGKDEIAKNIDTTKNANTDTALKTNVVIIKSGDNIYTIFKARGIPYSKENIEKVKKLNKKKSLRLLKLGEELILPENK